MSDLKLKQEAIMSTYARFPIKLIKGEGSYVTDENEVEYLDYTSGIATCNLGHRPEGVQKGLENQLNQLWHVSNLYHIEPQEKLAEQLVAHTCFDQVFFGNSGAEANEGAIKLARRYHQKVKETGKYEVVTFSQSFHGRTLATLKATAQEKIQDGFLPEMPGFRYLPYNDEAALDDLVHEETAAVLLELVQGEGGVIPAKQAFIDKLVRICHENGVLIIVDEIQTGVGRTGHLYCYEQYGFEPDILTTAKGLGSGLPIGAVLAKEEVSRAFSAGTHGSTFGGNPLVTTAGLKTIEAITVPGFLEDVQEKAAYFYQGLIKLKNESQQIKEVRGKGFLLGLLIDGKAIDLVHKAREEHHLLLVVAGPDVLRILPPLTTTKAEMDYALEVLRDLFAGD